MPDKYPKQYTAVADKILELQKQLDSLHNNLSQSYDDENFTIAAAAKLKSEIKHQQLLLETISKNLKFK